MSDRGMEAEGEFAEAFPGMPDSGRLWAFGVSQPLDAKGEAHLLSRVEAFVAKWTAHGHPLAAAYHWSRGRFLFIGLDQEVTPPSGCSIDHLVRILAFTGSEIGVEIVGNSPVWFRRADGRPFSVERPVFRALAAEGVVGPDTWVYDLSLTTIGELRAGLFEGPASEHWHARLLD
jgi:hypothetical protein